MGKQLSIGTKTAAYYSGYLAHATCYQDGTESVSSALDISDLPSKTRGSSP